MAKRRKKAKKKKKAKKRKRKAKVFLKSAPSLSGFDKEGVFLY